MVDHSTHTTEQTAMNKFLVIGGKPFVGYTRTTTYTDIRILGFFALLDEAEDCVRANYDDCGGLISIIDLVNETKVS